MERLAAEAPTCRSIAAAIETGTQRAPTGHRPLARLAARRTKRSRAPQLPRLAEHQVGQSGSPFSLRVQVGRRTRLAPSALVPQAAFVCASLWPMLRRRRRRTGNARDNLLFARLAKSSLVRSNIRSLARSLVRSAAFARAKYSLRPGRGRKKPCPTHFAQPARNPPVESTKNQQVGAFVRALRHSFA